MTEIHEFDENFDMRSDTPAGKDPDQHSPTLRRYQQLLWSKPLPSGAVFTLDTSVKSRYLHHTSELGEFFLASDAATRTFVKVSKAAPVISQISAEDREKFSRQGYTIGGIMVFPGNRIGRQPTINGARGMHPKIADRLDLTLESIRRHYLGESSPLEVVLSRYANFFALFENFRGYVDFFLLQDLVSDDYSEVRFFAPFDNFTTPPIPQTLEEYESYREKTLAYVAARNARIAAWVKENAAA
ncbi:MAG: DUF6994 family protein [Microbacteriaceae bacterium]